MSARSLAGTALVCALPVAGIVGSFALVSQHADAGTNPVMISQRVRTVCKAESETEWTFARKHDGAYVLITPKLSETTSENYPTRCVRTIVTRDWTGTGIVSRTVSVPVKPAV